VAAGPHSWTPQDHRITGKDRPQSETGRPDNTRDNQMARGKHKNISNRNQFDLATSELSSPTTARPGSPNTTLKQDSELNSHFMKMLEDFKKDINNFLKERQKNINKQVEALKKETHKSLKEAQENTIKQVKKLNKALQDLKMEVEAIKKSQRETVLEMESLGKRTGITDVSISNRIQEIEENLSGRRYKT
jgi:predicted RNase H-like nuclease (RuvC/YqgF family)